MFGFSYHYRFRETARGIAFHTIFVTLFLVSTNVLAGSVTVAWDPSGSTGVSGYKIHYGEQTGNYTSVIDVGNKTSHTLSNLTEGKTYYIAAKAYDVTHQSESGFSNEVSTLVHQAPVADFTSSTTTGIAPLTVSFTDRSTGEITGWLWDFGSLGTSAAKNVGLTYPEPGTYIVKLTVSGPGGTATKTVTISVLAPIAAKFAASPSSGVAPLTVNFVDFSTGSIVQRSWDFGDGGSSTDASPTHTYTAPGEYSVTLTVTGAAGNGSQTIDYVKVDAVSTGGEGGGNDPGPVAQTLPMEFGDTTIDTEWTRVRFTTQFSNPVVVVKPMSSIDPQPALVRIRNVDATGFDVRVQPWDYIANNARYAGETVSYIALERGIHKLPNGTLLEAGTIDTARTSFTTMSFQQRFNAVPVIVAAVSTVNDPAAVTTRLRRITTTSFQLRLQEEEASDQKHGTETVAYIAWEPSMGEVDGTTFQVARTPDAVHDQFYNILFQEDFPDTPAFVADMQSADGGDTANVRLQYKEVFGASVKVAEEQSRNGEMSHTNEVVGYIGLSAGTGTAPGTNPAPSRIWNDTVTPAILSDSDTSAVELGVKFRSQVDGYITGLLFYKSAANTGTHVGNLWSRDGTLLANVTFANETASGWQYQALITPVAITANMTYVVSYHTSVGRYSADVGYFTSAGVDNYPLRALRDGEDGSNGVYRYGSYSGFPNQSWNSSNYWVDVEFQP